MTWEWLTGYGWSPINPDFDQERVCQTALSDHLKPVRDAHPGISIQAAAIEGHPAPLLVKASEGADLLVVGSRGHGEFVGVLLLLLLPNKAQFPLPTRGLATADSGAAEWVTEVL